MMNDVQRRNLIKLFAQNEKHGVKQLGELAQIVDIRDEANLQSEREEMPKMNFTYIAFSSDK